MPLYHKRYRGIVLSTEQSTHCAMESLTLDDIIQSILFWLVHPVYPVEPICFFAPPLQIWLHQFFMFAWDIFTNIWPTYWSSSRIFCSPPPIFGLESQWQLLLLFRHHPPLSYVYFVPFYTFSLSPFCLAFGNFVHHISKGQYDPRWRQRVGHLQNRKSLWSHLRTSPLNLNL